MRWDLSLSLRDKHIYLWITKMLESEDILRHCACALYVEFASSIKLDHCIRVITEAITQPTNAPSCEEKVPLNKSLFLQFRCQMKDWTKSLSSSQLDTFISPPAWTQQNTSWADIMEWEPDPPSLSQHNSNYPIWENVIRLVLSVTYLWTNMMMSI